MINSINTKFTRSSSLPDVFAYVIRLKEAKGRSRTAANYRASAGKVSAYLGEDTATFGLQKVTSEWVSGFVDWLYRQHPDKPQTVDFYFRNTRAMYNYALSLQGTSGRPVVNPFKGMTIRGVRRSKRALSKHEIQKLLSAGLRQQLGQLQTEALDVLQFMLFMRGMVFQDVYNLTWDKVNEDGHIQYLRSKTGVPIDVAVSPEAIEIMNRYRQSDSSFVFPFLHKRQRKKGREISEESVLRRINRHARQIGEKAELSIPLTTYVMRHTWATLMLEADKSVELIGQCLGHASIRTTQIYLSNISLHKVDHEVNDMVNRMLRPEGLQQTSTGNRKKKTEKRKESDRMKKKQGSPPVKKLTGKQKKTTSEEKSLFLTKKETKFFNAIELDNYPAAKVLKINHFSKLLTTLFCLFLFVNSLILYKK